MTSSENGAKENADTARLRRLGSFPHVRILLGELITDRKLVPAVRQDVRNLETLPGGLKASVQKAEQQGSAWSAWKVDEECFAVTGYLDEVSSRMHAKPVLRVLLHDGKGRVIGSTRWLETRPNRWTACES